MELPEGYRLRPPRPPDAKAIVALLNEESRALVGIEVESVEGVTSPWTSPGVILDDDFAVLVGPEGGLVGYLAVEAEPPYSEVFFFGGIALPFHGRGLGALLLAEGERRARRFAALAEHGRRVVLHAGTLSGVPKIAELLEHHRYVEVRRIWSMRIEFDTPLPAAGTITGVELRGFVDGDEDAVYACLEDAFADHWGESWPTKEAWLHTQVRSPRFDPALWVLAWEGSELAGALIATLESDEDPTLGYVGELGVRRTFRRRGIGEVLLRTSFLALHERGRRGVCLHVDSESLTGATRLYERVGMTPHPRFSIWEKELRPAASV